MLISEQSETLKYLYLLFSDESVLPIERNYGYLGVSVAVADVPCYSRNRIQYRGASIPQVHSRMGYAVYVGSGERAIRSFYLIRAVLVYSIYLLKAGIYRSYFLSKKNWV